MPKPLQTVLAQVAAGHPPPTLLVGGSSEREAGGEGMKEESGGELFTVPQWDLTMRSLSVQKKKKMLAHARNAAIVSGMFGM